MKITDSGVIRAGEKELFDSIMEDIDWDAVKELVMGQINMKSLNSKGGEIMIHDNQVAFKIDLELKADVSLIFDKNGDSVEAEPVLHESGVSPEAKELDAGIEMPDFDTGKEQELEEEPDSGAEADESPLPGFDSDADVDFNLEDDLDGPDVKAGSDKGREEKEFDAALEGLSELTEDDDQDIIDLEQEFALSEDKADDDLTDDDKDIDDIIQESKKFWEQKK